MAKRQKHSQRKTFKKKGTAKRVAKRRGCKVYKVKGGYRLGKK